MLNKEWGIINNIDVLKESVPDLTNVLLNDCSMDASKSTPNETVPVVAQASVNEISEECINHDILNYEDLSDVTPLDDFLESDDLDALIDRLIV